MCGEEASMRIPVNLADTAVTVVGLRDKYHVPDLKAVDEHLRNLVNRIRAVGQGVPKLVAEYRHDIDLLLARRLYMTTTATEAEC